MNKKICLNNALGDYKRFTKILDKNETDLCTIKDLNNVVKQTILLVQELVKELNN